MDLRRSFLEVALPGPIFVDIAVPRGVSATQEHIEIRPWSGPPEGHRMVHGGTY